MRIVERPGYFGRRKDEKIREFNSRHGKGNWTLVWGHDDVGYYEFEEACILFYEWSYLEWFKNNPEALDHVTSYGECIDNAPTNVRSGCDYTKQEAFSTHIQDIAVRNVLRHNGREFVGAADDILIIRSDETNGYRYGPGNIPFYNSGLITYPSKRPRWANPGSVEDFWQSNKWLAIKESE